jgi:cytidylate kinase
MPERSREEPRIVAAAERQMKQWNMGQSMAEAESARKRIDSAHRRVGQFIAISREVGAGGAEIARRLGELLGWEVLDKNVLERIAERFHLSRPMLDLVDETSSNWAYDIFGSWMDRHIIPHEKYVVHLTQVLLAAARRGNVVFVGRGAPVLLQREGGLTVRLIAAPKFRVARIMQLFGLSECDAKRYMTRLERVRQRFVAEYFHHDIDDPHLYDLTISVDRVGIENAARLIVEAFGQREA